jgi:hypothetical protein
MILLIFLLSICNTYASGTPEEELVPPAQITIAQELAQPIVVSEFRFNILNHNLLIYTTRVQRIDITRSLYVTIVWDYDLEPTSLALSRTWINIGGLSAGFEAQAEAIDWAENHYGISPPERARLLGILTNDTPPLTPNPDDLSVLRAQLSTLRTTYVAPSSPNLTPYSD